MATIVLQAIPFCYGPAVVALRLRQGLLAAGHDVHLLAQGSIGELATLSDVPYAEYLSASDVERSLMRADAYCCICDPEMFKTLAGTSPLSIYVDFLYFMTAGDAPPPECNADLYLIENYPGVEDALKARSWAPLHPLVIAPLVASAVDTTEPTLPIRTVLLTFGGTESPFTSAGENTRYASVMTALVERFVRTWFPGSFLHTVGSPAAIGSLQTSCPQWSRRSSLGHAAFLRAMDEADVVICHPGLYTVFETVRRKRPVVFLPPSNYTQVVQLAHYVALGAAPGTVVLEQLLGSTVGHIALDLPEDAGVCSVLRVLDILERDEASLERLHSAVASQCAAIAHAPAAVVRRQAQALAEYASDGLPAAVAAISRLVGTRRASIAPAEQRADIP